MRRNLIRVIVSLLVVLMASGAFAGERPNVIIVITLDFSRDFRHLAASRSGGHVLLWDMDRPGQCLAGNRDCADYLRRLQAGSR